MISENLHCIIEMIHATPDLGVIVECGTGSIVSNKLYSVSGASKTIFESKQPYNKAAQNRYYGSSFKRSVSKEFIDHVLKVEIDGLPVNVNFVLATSFQIADKQNIEMLTHGWVGYADKNGNKIIAHYSLPLITDRNNYLNLIGEFVINLLASQLFADNSYLSSEYCDMVFDNNGENISQTLSVAFEFSDNENFIVSTPKGLIRFEDFVRDKEGIILQKGTYNPIHEGHIAIMELAKKRFPNHSAAFLVSLKKYDKADASFNDTIKLINKINELGYTVIVCRKPLFKENINWIKQRWSKLEIIFPVGIDTINRILYAEVSEANEHISKLKVKNSELNITSKMFEYFEVLRDYAYNNTKFLVFDRKGHSEKNQFMSLLKDIVIHETEYVDELGISSTKIRNGEFISKL